MDREEILSMPEYWASKAAFEWWKSLQEETRQDIEQGKGPDAIDIYEAGILYGWNNPNWFSVEDKLPPENGKTQQSISVWATDGLTSGEFRYNFDTKTWTNVWGDPFDITHWMPLPLLPQGKEY